MPPLPPATHVPWRAPVFPPAAVCLSTDGHFFSSHLCRVVDLLLQPPVSTALLSVEPSPDNTHFSKQLLLYRSSPTIHLLCARPPCLYCQIPLELTNLKEKVRRNEHQEGLLLPFFVFTYLSPPAPATVCSVGSRGGKESETHAAIVRAWLARACQH